MQTIAKIKWSAGAKDAEKRAIQLLPKKRHEVGQQICLVIDGMNLAYMAYYAYSKLSVKGVSTSILYGMPQMIANVLKRYKADKVIVCWDGKKHPARIAATPGYKLHREKSRTDKVARKKFLKEIMRTRFLLHRMGITQAWDEDVEGDDMIYLVTKLYQKAYRVIIVSGDKDFNQLINFDVNIYNPRNQNIEAVFAFAAKGMEIPQYVDYLCLVGDHSDDIKGVQGIGPARASAFLRKYYFIKYYLDDKKAIYPGLEDKEKLREIYERNKLMIDLAYFCELHYKNIDIKYFRNARSPIFNEEKYDIICHKWQLKTLLTQTFKSHFR